MKKILTGLLLVAAVGSVSAQKLNPNRFPSPTSILYDNNGNDLKGFSLKYKNDFENKGSIVLQAGGSDWSYVQLKNIKSPGINKKGELNYLNAFDVTLLTYKTRTSGKATWWSREFNLPEGKLQYFKAEDDGKIPYDVVKYTDVTNELQNKKMTIAEYVDTLTRPHDFELLFGNTLFVKAGTVREASDYSAIVAFYTKFLEKFTNVNDPVLDDKSFVTFVKAGSTEYVGYFNMVNGRLQGFLDKPESGFERDKVKFVNEIFRNITGAVVYVYGDDQFGMGKMVKAKVDKANLKMEMVKTSSSKKFNADF